jgi:RNA polymerase sigma factor (sigma-70 family)
MISKEDFSANITKISRILKPIALKLTKNADDAADLLQDTLIKGYTNRDKFAEGTNLKAWMYTIMRNIFNTNYQKNQRQNTFVDSSTDQYYINNLPSSTQNIAKSKLVQQDLTKALNKLENNYLSPFMMYFTGYKYHEIALRLNLPIGTVKNRIHIARKELKTMLKMYA